MEHLIKTQIIHLRLHEDLNAFHAQHLVSAYNYKCLLPLLNEVFDDLTKPEDLLKIDTLEVDLGVLPITEIENYKVPASLYSSLFSQVKKALQNTDKVSDILHSTIETGAARQWLFYMKRGFLPWNTVQTNEGWYQRVLEAFAINHDCIELLRELLVTEKKFLSRVVYDHSESFLVQLAEILTAKKQAQLPNLIKEISVIAKFVKTVASPISAKNDLIAPKTLWTHVLIAASQRTSLEPENFSRILLSDLISNPKVIKALVRKKGKELPVTIKTLVLISEHLNAEKSSNKNTKARKEASTTDDKKTETNIWQNISDQTPSVIPTPVISDEAGWSFPNQPKEDNKGLLPNLSQNRLSAEASEAEVEEIYVDQAGIVLLHPFLPAFFKKLELVEKGKFVSDVAQQKALYLLHYLATGQQQGKEHSLLMYKILCEHPFDVPVIHQPELATNETIEAENLLEAMIAQWEVLKNTSIVGLREGFLLRKGRYTHKKGKPQLQVENNAIDLLLDRLPWNINMIKLPWMKKILWVSWR